MTASSATDDLRGIQDHVDLGAQEVGASDPRSRSRRGDTWASLDGSHREVIRRAIRRPARRAVHISAALEYRWDALQTARTATTEEDMLQELLGLDRTRKPRTEKPWLRVDVTLRASTVWSKEIELPTQACGE